MATKTITQYFDDLDGTLIEDGRTVQFSWDGTAYEIDLTAENLAAFQAALAPYLNAARRDGSYRQPSAPKRRDRGVPGVRERQAIREWATANGYEVPARGRLTQTIQEAYEAAHAA